MEKELAHSFNIALGKEISKKITDVQKRLAVKFSERRNYDFSPHLAIATKFMGESETDVFIEALEKEFGNDVCWDLEFSGFSLSEEGTYIFLNLSEESRKIIFDLHKRAFEITKEIGFEGHGGLPPMYPYDPHISIIKIQPEEAAEVIKLIDEDFLNMKIPVKSYEITRREDREMDLAIFLWLIK